VAAQQEFFRKWVNVWPVPAFPFGEPQQFAKKWARIVGEMFQHQNDVLAVQFKVAFGTIDKLFRLAEVKDPEQFRTRAMEMWQNAFDDLWQISEGQIRALQHAVARFTEVTSKESKPAGPTVPAPVPNAAKPRTKETGKIPVQTKSDREELKEAMQEYEMTKGDWSKGR
jgi:hypothetical protein